MKTFKSIPIEWLQRGHFQPRKIFNEAALQELAASIQAQGLIEPLVVRELPNQRFEIIAGERRWRAAMIAGLKEVPCLIDNYTDEQTAAITLIENIQRQDLTLLEEASGYQRLYKEFHFNQDEIATLVGKSRSHVANILRLLSLCDAVQERLNAGQLSLGHARALIGLSPQQQLFFANKIKQNDWSVRRLEDEVRTSKLTGTAPERCSKTTDLTHLQTQLAEHIGTPVQIITDNEQGGWLKIKFFDNDTLSGLLERMGLRYD